VSGAGSCWARRAACGKRAEKTMKAVKRNRFMRSPWRIAFAGVETEIAGFQGQDKAPHLELQALSGWYCSKFEPFGSIGLY